MSFLSASWAVIELRICHIFTFRIPALKVANDEKYVLPKSAVKVYPAGWTRLAYSEKAQYQAARVDNRHYLIQEDRQAAYPSTLREWFTRDRTWACEGTGVDEREILEEATKNQVFFRDVYRQIFRNFINLTRTARRPTWTAWILDGSSRYVIRCG